MIRPDQIPDEVVEAAARVFVEVYGIAWDDAYEADRADSLIEARAAIAAALNAWPGAWHIRPVDFEEKLILPLPQKDGDA